ncbi:hypothetical protein SAMN05216377_12429 [Pseudonocardia oroxyli]|uniref:Major facilitator superfamily (MFS) profile domain-containing protein n=1 Tax=Pseudonocardia oroxyli TaxID=366584 RepID=A0A1G8D1N0_PSEOR|nr:hypothetical protein SAMN05216377_12429 [Pseudonocardia oroxyli]
MRDLGIGPAESGLISSSFFLLFSLSTILVGFLAARVSSRWVLAAMAFMWALTRAPSSSRVSRC